VLSANRTDDPAVTPAPTERLTIANDLAGVRTPESFITSRKVRRAM
jgi:hypothetical protein